MEHRSYGVTTCGAALGDKAYIAAFLDLHARRLSNDIDSMSPGVILQVTRTRTNTNPNGTEANAAGRSGNSRALRKQSKCGMIQEGEGHWPNSSKNLQKKARNFWVLRTPQNNKEAGVRAKKLVTCGTRGPLGRGQSVPFSAQGACCSAPEP
jgi:hypothetical protein